MQRLLNACGLLLLWGLLTAVALWARPLAPIDETRYAAVAWDMWAHGHWLVPHLNGEAYSHKPPLLFWLIQLGWAVFGVVDWVPRLITALATLADLFLIGALARRLWPQDAASARLAPWLFYGCFYVALFGTMLMFDLLLATTVLLGLLGLLGAAEHGGRGHWALYALGIGLGVLCKGPAVLVYLLPVALLAPWWQGGARVGGWWRWYRNVGLAVLAGAALALCWALPAAIVGGAEYREMIFWGQTAGRMVQSFAHQRPWWWYLPILPAILLPWPLWLPLWRALPGLRTDFGRAGRFCVAWCLPGFLVFSAVSGKQVHYLLPLLPALLLLAARALTQRPRGGGWLGQALVLAPFALLGLVAAIGPFLAARQGWPDWVAEVSPWWGLGVVLLVLVWARVLRARSDPRWLAVLPVFCGALLYAGVVRIAAPTLDARPIAAQIAALQAQGVSVAHPGKYHGEFQFAGRLQQPLQVIARGSELDWAKANPQGALLLRHRALDTQARTAAVFVQPYREREAALWRAATLIEHPEYLAGEDAGRDDKPDSDD